MSTDRSSAIAELLDIVPPFDERRKSLLLTALESREQAGATVVHESISMPHCRSILVDDFEIVLGRSKKGVGWPEEKVELVILFISPVTPKSPEEHTQLIKQFADRIKDGGAEKIFAAEDCAELAELLDLDLLDGG
ncbi:hypothetical protein GF402_02225 [Candidatus Fermentibacteria bacterium]|nr:hypothetical protein [Candidatus Fermentibacteria bacterium]